MVKTYRHLVRDDGREALGNTVVIHHDGSIEDAWTTYNHLNSILVRDGQRVFTGEAIGTIGDTGDATGAHLHWSMSTQSEAQAMARWATHNGRGLTNPLTYIVPTGQAEILTPTPPAARAPADLANQPILNRKFRLEIEAAGRKSIVIEEPLACTFEVEYGEGSPEPGKIVIFNLSTATSLRITDEEPKFFRLFGGYGNAGLICTGDIRLAEDKWDQPNRMMELTLGQNDSARREGTVMNTWRNRPIYEIIDEAARAMGLQLGPFDHLPELLSHTSDSYNGPAKSLLDIYLGDFGIEQVIHCGGLFLFRQGIASASAPVFTIYEGGGMIGIPTRQNDGRVVVATRLNPVIVPGMVVNIEARGFEGRHEVLKIKHTGDTWGGPFQTEIEALVLPDAVDG